MSEVGSCTIVHCGVTDRDCRQRKKKLVSAIQTELGSGFSQAFEQVVRLQLEFGKCDSAARNVEAMDITSLFNHLVSTFTPHMSFTSSSTSSTSSSFPVYSKQHIPNNITHLFIVLYEIGLAALALTLMSNTLAIASLILAHLNIFHTERKIRGREHIVGNTTHQLVSREIGKGSITEGHCVCSHLEAVSRLHTALLLTAAYLVGTLHIHLDDLLVALEGDDANVGLHTLTEGNTDGSVSGQVGLVVLGMDEENVGLDDI